LQPDTVVSNGQKYQRRALLRWGPDHCFYRDDLYTLKLGSEATGKVQELGPHDALVFMPDRTWQIIGSRDAGIAELVLRDTANVSENVGQERS
jgi:hypothetical protein